VQATIFAARIGSDAGYAVPSEIVSGAVADAATQEVSTGPCVR
jgi:hypothetical protein